MINYNAFIEFSKFNNIKFYEEPHVYFIDDQQVISVTGLLHKFTDEFDEDKWLPIKAEEMLSKPSFILNGETEDSAFERAQRILKDEWTFKNRHGIYEGKLIHRYLENLMMNKDISDDKSGNEMVSFSDIESTFYRMKKLAYNFYVEFVQSGKLIPVKSELVVGVKELGLAGQIDQLFFDTELGCLCLYDWKSNRKLDRSSKFVMKHCLSHLDSCELNTYSLQLHTYKYMLEKNTKIKIHPIPKIVWFNEFNEKAHIIDSNPVEKEVQDMLLFKAENPELFKPKPYIRPGIPVFELEKVTTMEELLNFK